MFDYFIGVVKEIGTNTVVLENSGIGFEFTAGRYCLNGLRVGETAKIYAYLNVKEDEISLFGFKSKEEKAMFLRLTSISGIGAKSAIGILSGLDLNELCVAIATGDSKALGGIKGIGKKTAERIVLELHDKLNEEFSVEPKSVDVTVTDKGEDAVLALMSLGFTKQESVNAIKKIDISGMSLEDIIKAALKRG